MNTACWTVEDVREHLGLQDSADPNIDAKIEQSMAMTLSAIERYCNRLFGYRQDYEETIYKTKGDGWQFHLWPVKSQIDVDGVPCNEVTIDNQTGIAWFDHYNYTRLLKVSYSGGYLECDFPADLLAVMFGSISGAYQLITGGQYTDSAISKITIPDVGTITYDNSTNSNIGFGGAFIGGIIPMHWQSTLDFYRLHEC
jgi:hypothetical protein